MPKYAVDFVADIEVVKCDEVSGPAGKCKENFCQTENITQKNVRETVMGNVQCLVTNADKAPERKILVSRGIQCGKSKLLYNNVIDNKPDVEAAAEVQTKSTELSQFSTRPCVSGVNLQTIKDIRQEGCQPSQQPAATTAEPPEFKDRYLKQKRKLLLSKLKLLENGEDAEIDSLSDTLSNLDIKAELQRHLSEFYRQKNIESQNTNDVLDSKKIKSQDNTEEKVNLNRDSHSFARGDDVEENVSNCVSKDNFAGCLRLKKNFNAMKTGDDDNDDQINFENKSEMSRDSIVDNQSNVKSDQKTVGKDNNNSYHATQASKSSLLGSEGSIDKYSVLPFPCSVSQIDKKILNLKNSGGDVGDSHIITERPPLHPLTKPQLPQSQPRYMSQQDGSMNPTAVFQNQSNSLSCARYQPQSPLKPSEVIHQTRKLSNFNSTTFLGDCAGDIPAQALSTNKSDDSPDLMRKYISQGQDVVSAQQMKKTLDSNVGLSSVGKPHFIRGKSVTQKFYIPESANIEKILGDHNDRRIKAICDRHHCDIEVYSRVPRSGFMKNIMILTAPSQEALKKCVRSLDCSFKWCISSQLK